LRFLDHDSNVAPGIANLNAIRDHSPPSPSQSRLDTG
jgi:hypothetical protein